ncbi:MAG: nucleotide exchange factor GrpE [Bdellovibrio sp.]
MSDHKDSNVKDSSHKDESTQQVVHNGIHSADSPSSEFTISAQGDPEVQGQQIRQLQQDLEKSKQDFLYLRAEFDTYKRNSLKENFELRKYGAEKFVADLLSVIDNFERALETQTTSENWPQFVKGIEMTAGELRSLLVKHGVQELPCLGKAFDPQTQEALGQEPSTLDSGKVTRVFRKPYKMHEKTIRTGQVIVSSGVPNEGSV